MSRATAYNLTRQKSFYPAFRLGKRTIVSVQALHRWLEEQCQL
ncbi:MAG: helix-turn-helix domain-containing protein [Clostridia bacterium]|nr:helix-turn-helix domain-containing protein [Clostridia bacterium]